MGFKAMPAWPDVAVDLDTTSEAPGLHIRLTKDGDGPRGTHVFLNGVDISRSVKVLTMTVDADGIETVTLVCHPNKITLG